MKKDNRALMPGIGGVLFSLLFFWAMPISAQEESPSGGTYRIGAGDVLDIVVWKNADLSRNVTVRPDGWISLPLINEVQVAGLTPTELQQILSGKYEEFATNPTVSIIVNRVNSFKVSILGKVKSPGRYLLDGPTTVLDLVALAGGFDEFSSRDDVYLLRSEGDNYRRIPVKFSEATKATGKEVNIYVRPGDIIVVP